MGNVAAARRLLQTGLRNCKGSIDLWVDYFKMELLFAKKLLERRKVLGLGSGGEEADGEAAGAAEGAMRDGQDPSAEGAADPQSADPQSAPADPQSAKEALRLVLAGGAAAAVLRNALRSLGPEPPAALVLRFLSALEPFSGSFPHVRSLSIPFAALRVFLRRWIRFVLRVRVRGRERAWE